MLLLLVYDDKTDIVERCKDSRARSDTYPRLSPLYTAISIISLAVRQHRMNDHRSVTVNTAEIRNRLRSERYFRYKHDHLSAVGKHTVYHSLDNTRLSAAGNSVHKRRACIAERITRLKLIVCPLLSR